MYNKENIMSIIADFDTEIAEFEKELSKPCSDKVKELIKSKIGNLKDNQYRYKLQAKAWGLIK